MPNLLDTYTALTAAIGFGLHTSRYLRRVGGLGWAQICALTDAGLIRVERCVGDDVQYRLLFP